MKSLSGLLVCVSALFAQETLTLPPALRADGVPPIPLALMERLDQYGDFRAASLQGWRPGARETLITTRFGNTPQLHLVKQPGGARSQLTFLRDRVQWGRWRPGHADQIVYGADTGGAEFTQLYLLDLATGRAVLLTDGKSQNSSPVFSRDGRWLAHGSTRRNGRDRDIYLVDLDQRGAARTLAEVTGGGWSPVAFSTDQKQLLVHEYRSAADSTLHVIDVASGSKRAITPQGTASWDGIGFTGDGKTVYAVTDMNSEFARIARIDLGTGSVSYPIRSSSQWDVDSASLSPDGRRLAYVRNEDGLSVLAVVDTASHQEVRLPALPAGVIGAGAGSNAIHWNRSGTEIAFSLTSVNSPPDVYSIQLDTAKLERWTQSETGGIDASRFRPPQIIKWKSFDGRMISGFLYRPPLSFTGRRPVIINIHGGPEGQSRPMYLGRNGYLVEEKGIALIYPNVRGSTGYGKTFLGLDNGFRREDSVKDIGALLDWIAAQPDLDPQRVMVTGGSYGGYMTLASMVHFNDRLRCAVEAVGISNFVTFLERTEAYRRDLRRAEYGDEREPKMRDFMQTTAPLNHVAKMRKPMMIVQGRNDPRVPWTESQQIVAALRQQQTPTWYLLAADEGHGFAKKANQDALQAATVLFIDEFLLK
jgi:dipeptidyl aminopeptidase/acylaminoacyl peptidase